MYAVERHLEDGTSWLVVILSEDGHDVFLLTFERTRTSRAPSSPLSPPPSLLWTTLYMGPPSPQVCTSEDGGYPEANGFDNDCDGSQLDLASSLHPEFHPLHEFIGIHARLW
jgi:hypothetical protein